YMKVYDPAFERVRREVGGMGDLRFLQIHHYHTDNSHHLAQFRLRRAPGDVPASHREATQQARRAAVRAAIGDAPPGVEGAFFRLAGSMIHDLYGLRHLAGPPARVLHTEIWNDGWGISTLLELAGGA